MTLTDRIEQADESQQRELLVSAWRDVFGDRPRAIEQERRWIASWQPFVRKLDAEAWESAALMLVPRGWIVEITRAFNSDGEYVSRVTLTDSFTVGRGCDPEEEVSVTACKVEVRELEDPTALAIAAAALRARG